MVIFNSYVKLPEGNGSVHYKPFSYWGTPILRNLIILHLHIMARLHTLSVQKQPSNHQTQMSVYTEMRNPHGLKIYVSSCCSPQSTMVRGPTPVFAASVGISQSETVETTNLEPFVIVTFCVCYVPS